MDEQAGIAEHKVVTTDFRIVAEDGSAFRRDFDGEPQINLTFEHDGHVYRVASRAHDEHESEPTFHVTRA